MVGGDCSLGFQLICTSSGINSSRSSVVCSEEFSAGGRVVALKSTLFCLLSTSMLTDLLAAEKSTRIPGGFCRDEAFDLLTVKRLL